MQSRISAVIIDPLKNKHNYEDVVISENSPYYCPYGEFGFDLNILDSSENIYKVFDENRGFDCLITIGNNIDFDILNNLSFEFRKKWIHMDAFDAAAIASNIIACFIYNINRERSQEVKLFSIFTCTYNTSDEMIYRLYNSLKNQSYKNWNWFIVDDSRNSDVIEKLQNLHDPRITVVSNVTNHGSIGFNKKLAAMMCDGDYLVEVDHDDELTEDCLFLLNKAFEKFPDSDFVYSYTFEEINGYEIDYGDCFMYGLGKYRTINIHGIDRRIALTPDVNALSVRGIYALPNHVRCWKAEFYRKIGGHNPELSVLDDMDLLIRTFLYGKMTKVDTVLYIQHEGTSNGVDRGSTTQSVRFKEIQRTNKILYIKYDKQIHDRILELGEEDLLWDENEQHSNLFLPDKELKSFNNTFFI